MGRIAKYSGRHSDSDRRNDANVDRRPIQSLRPSSGGWRRDNTTIHSSIACFLCQCGQRSADCSYRWIRQVSILCGSGSLDERRIERFRRNLLKMIINVYYFIFICLQKNEMDPIYRRGRTVRARRKERAPSDPIGALLSPDSSMTVGPTSSWRLPLGSNCKLALVVAVG